MRGARTARLYFAISPIISLFSGVAAAVVFASRGDIARWREDMNSIFKRQNNILRTSAASEILFLAFFYYIDTSVLLENMPKLRYR